MLDNNQNIEKGYVCKIEGVDMNVLGQRDVR